MIVSKVEFGEIAMQMLLAAMLIDAAHGRVATQCETKCGTKKARLLI